MTDRSVDIISSDPAYTPTGNMLILSGVVQESVAFGVEPVAMAGINSVDLLTPQMIVDVPGLGIGQDVGIEGANLVNSIDILTPQMIVDVPGLLVDAQVMPATEQPMWRLSPFRLLRGT